MSFQPSHSWTAETERDARADVLEAVVIKGVSPVATDSAG
jgi:hypothetical protein